MLWLYRLLTFTAVLTASLGTCAGPPASQVPPTPPRAVPQEELAGSLPGQDQAAISVAPLPSATAGLPQVEPVPQTPVITPPTPLATAVPPISPLKRRDAPPDGIQQQIGFAGGGPGGCSRSLFEGLGTASVPQVFFATGQVDTGPGARPGGYLPPLGSIEIAELAILLQTPIICLGWFSPDSFVDIRIDRPDGTNSSRTVALDNEGFGGVPWVSLVGEPVGTYTITASQGELQAVGQLDVLRATVPRVLVWPRDIAPGDPATVHLAGFAPGQVVAVHLYQERSYITTLSTVMNEWGEQTVVLETEPDDMPGTYQAAIYVPGITAANYNYAEFSVGQGNLLDYLATVRASSVLPAELLASGEEVRFVPANVLDQSFGTPPTAWVEGVPGPGIGERVELLFAEPVRLTAIEIITGFTRSPEIFAANNRVRRATLLFSDGGTQSVELLDQIEAQRVPVSALTTSLSLIIEDVYPGSQYEDSAITQLHPLGYETR